MSVGWCLAFHPSRFDHSKGKTKRLEYAHIVTLSESRTRAIDRWRCLCYWFSDDGTWNPVAFALAGACCGTATRFRSDMRHEHAGAAKGGLYGVLRRHEVVRATKAESDAAIYGTASKPSGGCHHRARSAGAVAGTSGGHISR